MLVSFKTIFISCIKWIPSILDRTLNWNKMNTFQVLLYKFNQENVVNFPEM